MFMLNKRVQKLIAKGTALIITLTVMIGAAWAILSTEKVGLTVSVSFDSAVTAKVYLATNSSSALDFKQPNSTVTAENFAKANSALILDTKDGNSLQKDAFELLGADNGLKCDANGEMEFYVYVENYSTTESVYYRANIDFVGTGEQTAPFSTATNPNYETAETAGGGSPSKSLLTFKIKSTSTTGFNANAIQIEIEMQTEYSWQWSLSQYIDGTFANMYYFELGKAPQSYAGTITEGDDFIDATIIEPSKTWIDGKSYYTDNINPNIHYVLNGDNYYLVEPIRWIILADGRYDGTGLLGIDYFADKKIDVTGNQLLVVSEELLSTISWNSSMPNSPDLKSKIFTTRELSLLTNITYKYYYDELKTIPTNFFLLTSGNFKTSGTNFNITDYLITSTLRTAYRTSYLTGIAIKPTSFSNYWAKDLIDVGSNNYYYYLNSSGTIAHYNQSSSPTSNIRPAFVINYNN